MGRLLKGFNDLATLYPAIAAEWDYENNDGKTPDQFTRASNKRVNWVCSKCSYRWSASIEKRSIRGSGCPCCAGKVVVKGINDLATFEPVLAAEWDYENNDGKTPDQFTRASGKSANWVCSKCGYRWPAQIKNRSVHGVGCPCCAGKVAVKGINDLATLEPVLATEWDYENNGGKTPDQFTRASGKSANWVCSRCGYRWSARIATRSVHGAGCPCCAGNVIVKGINDLATLEPVLAAEWDYENNDGKTPDQFSRTSDNPANWVCSKCDYRWSARIVTRSVLGTGCPCCAGNVVVKGINDFVTLEPALAAGWDYENNDGKTPDQFTRASGKLANWVCSKCGYRWSARIATRSSHGKGCPCCAGKVVVKGINDLATLEPALAAEWDYENNNGRTPDQFTRASNKQVHWVCSKCGYRWPARIVNRSIPGTGCPCCAGKVVVKGINDLATLEPALAAEWDYENNDDKTPDQFTKGSHETINWVCSKCGYRWPARIANRRIPGTGCPCCAGKVVVKGINDLATLAPVLVAEWDYENNDGKTPDQVAKGSDKLANWICSKCGYRWPARIEDRTIQGAGCPCCAGRKRKEPRKMI